MANIFVYDNDTLKQFENIDMELATYDQISNKMLVNNNDENNLHIDAIGENEEEIEAEKVTLYQAFNALNKLKGFLATNEHSHKSYSHTKQIQILEKSLYLQTNKITNKNYQLFKKIKIRHLYVYMDVPREGDVQPLLVPLIIP